jgi:hypothetical protein
MENKIINVSLKSNAVVNKMNSLHLNEMDIWCVFFDSGIEYLENLKKHVRRKRVFDKIFGNMLERIGDMHPAEVFNRILAAPEFWQWWSSCLWFACREVDTNNLQELTNHLQYSNVLIPQSVMNKIFDDEKIRIQEKNIRTRAAKVVEFSA